MGFVENVNKLAAVITDTLQDELTTMQNDITDLQTNKVDKVPGKSLIDNTEIARLSSVATGATKNSPDAILLNRANHTGTQSADTITNGLINAAFTLAEKNKLANLSTTTPPSHVHSASEITTGNFDASRIDETASRVFVTPAQKALINTSEQVSNKGVPGGYVPLNSSGKIDPGYLDSINVVDVFVASDEATMLGLSSASVGDICIRADYPATSTYSTYMLKNTPASTLANWIGINTSAVVSSVNGKAGVVTLSTSDISEGTNLYYTDERVDDRVASLLKAGTNVSLNYNDTAGTLTISAIGARAFAASFCD